MNTQPGQNESISDIRTGRAYHPESSRGCVSDKIIIISEENFEMWVGMENKGKGKCGLNLNIDFYEINNIYLAWGGDKIEQR